MGEDHKTFAKNMSPDVAALNPEFAQMAAVRQTPEVQMMRKGSAPSEHDEQVSVFQWAAASLDRFPELEMLHSTPNAGKRTPRMGAWYKAEGLRAGYPDISLDVARGGYHGLRIEMKIGRNKPSENQIWWMARLTEQGYKCLICYSAEDAIGVITNYLIS